MSTKIFHAYRIDKNNINNIFNVLHSFKKDAKDYVKNNDELLKRIHVLSAVWVMENEDEDKLRDFLNGNILFSIGEYLRECEKKDVYEFGFVDINLEMAVYSDKDYWYVKFFPNINWQYDFIKQLNKDYKFLEDYHYQNQTDDIPDDMSWDEFQKRGDHWDELLNDRNNFRDWLQFTLFDSREFYNIMAETYYDDESKQYSNLAYDFNSAIEDELSQESKVKY